MKYFFYNPKLLRATTSILYQHPSRFGSRAASRKLDRGARDLYFDQIKKFDFSHSHSILKLKANSVAAHLLPANLDKSYQHYCILNVNLENNMIKMFDFNHYLFDTHQLIISFEGRYYYGQSSLEYCRKHQIDPKFVSTYNGHRLKYSQITASLTIDQQFFIFLKIIWFWNQYQRQPSIHDHSKSLIDDFISTLSKTQATVLLNKDFRTTIVKLYFRETPAVTLKQILESLHQYFCKSLMEGNVSTSVSNNAKDSYKLYEFYNNMSRFFYEMELKHSDKCFLTKADTTMILEQHFKNTDSLFDLERHQSLVSKIGGAPLSPSPLKPPNTNLA